MSGHSNPPNQDHSTNEIEQILDELGTKLGDAWEKYDGGELDDLDEYGDLYDKAYRNASAQLSQLLIKERIDEVSRFLAKAEVDKFGRARPLGVRSFRDRIAQLESQLKGGDHVQSN